MDVLVMRADRYALVQEMQQLANKTDATSVALYRQKDAQQEALRVQIEQIERSAELERELQQVRRVPGSLPTIGEQFANAKTPTSRALALRSAETYKQEFDTFLRTGQEGSQMAEVRALGAASGADGATLVPQGFEAELEVKLKAWGGMRRLCRILKTSTGNPLPWPRLDDTSSVGEFLTEGSGVGSGDPTFDNVTLGSNLVSSKQVKVSVQLEQDSVFDVASLLSDAFAIRLGRTTNYAYTLGNNSGGATDGTIVGLITALTSAGGRSVLAVGANTNSGSAGDNDLNSVGSDDLSNLITAVDPAYRTKAKFAANQSTWDKMRSLKDKYGRMLWAVSLASNVPDSIFGYAYDYNQDMAAIGAGNKSVVFGDFSKYVIRDVLGITLVRYNETYMPNFQRGYQAFLRTDAKLLQSSAFAYLIHPLS